MQELLKNIFASQSKKDLDQKMNEAEKSLDLTGDIARQCLAHDDFNLYRESYQRTEQSIVDSLIVYTKNFVEVPGGDMSKYCLTVVRLLTKLQDMRYLLRSVENDSKKGLPNEKKAEA